SPRRSRAGAFPLPPPRPVPPGPPPSLYFPPPAPAPPPLGSGPAGGRVSGRDEDKFNAWGIPVVTGPELGLPLIEEKCLAWMECRLLPATAAQTQYDTLFGEVVSAAADERAFVTGRWQFDDDKLNTLHHLGTGNFVASGRHVRANSLDE
ncbi:flavin reductase, partial [Klebsiella pneumoniae]|uniref:flavin reductase n=1 Tax=Klebsiella pneumoniae TaxID=573 RepID=UPI003742E82E